MNEIEKMNKAMGTPETSTAPPPDKGWLASAPLFFVVTLIVSFAASILAAALFIGFATYDSMYAIFDTYIDASIFGFLVWVAGMLTGRKLYKKINN